MLRMGRSMGCADQGEELLPVPSPFVETLEDVLRIWSEIGVPSAVLVLGFSQEIRILAVALQQVPDELGAIDPNGKGCRCLAAHLSGTAKC